MATNNQIGSGAVVLVANADKLVAGLKQAEAETNDFAKRTQSKLSSAMSQMWERDRNVAKAMAGGDWSQVLNGPPKPPKPIDTAAAAQAKSLMEGLSKSAASANASVDKMNMGLGGIAKGLKLSEAAGMGLLGAMTALHKAAFDAVALQHNDKLASGLEERERLEGRFVDHRQKYFENRNKIAEQTDFDSLGDTLEMIKTQRKELHGIERSLNGMKDLKQKMENDFDRYLGKSTVGKLPVFDTIHKQQEQFLKSNLSAKQKQYDDQMKHVNELTAHLVDGLVKREIWPPIRSGLDEYMGKAKSFFDLVVGNHKAIQDATKETIRNLEDEAAAYDKVGMSAGDAAVFDAKRRGETNEEKLAEIRIKAETNDRRKNKIAIDEEVKAMEKQAGAYGLTAAAAKRKDLIDRNATEEQLKLYDAAVEKMNQIDRERAMNASDRFAAAIQAGSKEAYSVEIRMKYGSEFQDQNRVHKENGRKLDEIKKGQLKVVDAVEALGAKWDGAL